MYVLTRRGGEAGCSGTNMAPGSQAMHWSTRASKRTRFIIFLGTPHRGSAAVGWGQIASNLAALALQDTNNKILKTLKVNAEVLDNIHREFKTIVYRLNIKIHSFQEAKAMTGIKGLNGKVGTIRLSSVRLLTRYGW